MLLLLARCIASQVVVVAIVTEYDVDQTECLCTWPIGVPYSGIYTLGVSHSYGYTTTTVCIASYLLGSIIAKGLGPGCHIFGGSLKYRTSSEN